MSGSGCPGGAVTIAGIDEVGRGPLAGPVIAAAVVLDPARPIAGLKDSKALSAAARERLAVIIRREALAHALGSAGRAEIDSLNILEATLLAMGRAFAALGCTPGRVQVDGNRAPDLPGFAGPVTPVVGGDRTCPAISAASILAKVHRDGLMRELHAVHPAYGFDRHMGYPTPAHLAALARHGPCSEHRRSFAPVRRVLAGGSP